MWAAFVREQTREPREKGRGVGGGMETGRKKVIGREGEKEGKGMGRWERDKSRGEWKRDIEVRRSRRERQEEGSERGR